MHDHIELFIRLSALQCSHRRSQTLNWIKPERIQIDIKERLDAIINRCRPCYLTVDLRRNTMRSGLHSQPDLGPVRCNQVHFPVMRLMNGKSTSC